MMKLIVLLTGIFVLFVPSVARADVSAGAQQFETQAQQIIAEAIVTYKGNDWGPIPLYTVDLRPMLNATIDTADYTADAARADPGVLAIVETELWENAGSPPAPALPVTPAPPAVPEPTLAQGSLTDAVAPFVSQAQTMLSAATVTLVGTSWGPIPIYDVDLISSLNMNGDVAAASADAARSDPNIVALVATRLWENAGSPPAPSNVPAPQTQTTTPSTSSTAPQDQTDVTPAADPASTDIPTSTPSSEGASVASPVIPAAETTVSSVLTFAPSIKITLSAPAAKQPTVAAQLTTALGAEVTLAKTVRLTSAGKVTTLTKVKSLLAKGKSVKVRLHKVAGMYVVTGIAL